jgi:hypothetical protein
MAMMIAWFHVFDCFFAWMRFVLMGQRESNGTQNEFPVLFVLLYSARRWMMRTSAIGNSDANGQVFAFRVIGHVTVPMYLGHANIAMNQAIMENDSLVAWEGDIELDAGRRRD